MSPQGRAHPYSKLCRWETILQAQLFMHPGCNRAGTGDKGLLLLVSSLDLPDQDRGLQDLGEALLPSRSEGLGQTQPGRAAQPRPLGQSWPLSPPLTALPSPQRLGEAPQVQKRPAKKKLQKQLKLVIRIPSRNT